ncbi:hypothetical protein JOQ06_024648 [Pogonophryne albipinna]|uniref:Ribosome biogenesis protein BOP1 n=1 Tax=Pogonophryne albipinna TaxID=1090488 RepID=A0AAD6A7T8_9TELE|nr:hypothetical protein JOQ06_024648 [Pogonophryne albipinna]
MVFDLNNKTAGDEGDDEDLSDSEDSVFSGLEDSGSDSEDEEEEEEEGSHEEEELKDDQILQPEKKKGGLTAEEEKKEDEYRQDSSDEEDIRNTVGNIPMDWYKDFPHIGYNLDGKKIFKPIRNKDELDEFLDKMDNPDYWRTIHDKQTGSDIILSDDQVALVNRLQRGQFGDLHFNEYQPQVEFFSSDVMLHPVTNRPADKRSFIPSLVEKEKVSKLVHAIKMGWIKPKRHEEAGGRFYDLWANEDCTTSLARLKMHLPAPRAPLPGHMESYNPPPEYLFTEEEKALWEQQDVSDRKCPFVPRRFSSLLQVPAFPRFLHERFERCLDLYLCPRQRKLRLPKPKDLQPFPTTQSLVYRGHSGLVRSISVSPSGQWLASGSDDGSVRFWEVCSSRCLKTVQVGGAVKSVAWNPNTSLSLLAVALDSMVLVLSPSLADKQVVSASERLLAGPQGAEPAEEAGPVTWTDTEGEELNQGIRLKIQHPKPVQQVAWHAKGDYLASVMPDHSSHLQVFIHQIHHYTRFTTSPDSPHHLIHHYTRFTTSPDSPHHQIHHITRFITSPYSPLHQIHHITRFTTLPDSPHYQIHHITRFTTLPDSPHHQIHHITRFTTLPDSPHHQIHHITRFTTSPDSPHHQIHHNTRFTTSPDSPHHQIHHNTRFTTLPDSPHYQIHHITRFTTSPDSPQHQIHHITNNNTRFTITPDSPYHQVHQIHHYTRFTTSPDSPQHQIHHITNNNTRFTISPGSPDSPHHQRFTTTPEIHHNTRFTTTPDSPLHQIHHITNNNTRFTISPDSPYHQIHHYTTSPTTTSDSPYHQIHHITRFTTTPDSPLHQIHHITNNNTRFTISPDSPHHQIHHYTRFTTSPTTTPDSPLHQIHRNTRFTTSFTTTPDSPLHQIHHIIHHYTRFTTSFTITPDSPLHQIHHNIHRNTRFTTSFTTTPDSLLHQIHYYTRFTITPDSPHHQIHHIIHHYTRFTITPDSPLHQIHHYTRFTTSPDSPHHQIHHYTRFTTSPTTTPDSPFHQIHRNTRFTTSFTTTPDSPLHQIHHIIHHYTRFTTSFTITPDSSLHQIHHNIHRDHVICGSYDCRLSWFDLDLSTKPYKMLRHHKKAVRGVAYHRLYPLFASASDDGSVIVCHGTVYNDLLQNPLLVPVKVLRGHAITHDLGVLDVTFHPSQPWVFSSGADATIRLFT